MSVAHTRMYGTGCALHDGENRSFLSPTVFKWQMKQGDSIEVGE